MPDPTSTVSGTAAIPGALIPSFAIAALPLSAPSPSNRVREIERYGQRTDPILLAEQASLRTLATVDPQEARAQELEGPWISDFRAAERIRRCSNPANPPSWRRTCKRRDCPTCAAAVARRNRDLMAAAMRTMGRRLLVLFTLRSNGIDDLWQTVRTFRHLVAAIRRRSCFRAVRCGVGAVEIKLTDAEDAWLVHAHLVIDAPVIDFAAIVQVWKGMTRDRGTFGPHPTDPEVRRSGIMAVATYATKCEHWCPMPGSLCAYDLDVLRRGIRGIRLLVEWGFSARRRSGSNGLQGGSTR